MAPKPGDEKCIDKSKYQWTSAGAGRTEIEILTSIESKLTDVVDLLNVIASKMPGVAPGGTGYGYSSYEVAIPSKETNYEIGIGMVATNLNIRIDQPVKIRINSTSADEIYMDPGESPLALTDFMTGISTIYVTTGYAETTVKILAYS